MNEIEEPKETHSKLPEKQELKHEIIEFVKMVVWFLILFMAVRKYVIEGYEVQGPSMQPTLQDNERILVLKLPLVLSRLSLFSSIDGISEGDIVVFDSPPQEGQGKRYVKRVIAKGVKKRNKLVVGAQNKDDIPAISDMVSVKFDNGIVYVNNRAIIENYTKKNGEEDDDEDYANKETLVPPSMYFVMGDNRDVSKDSRNFGPVDDDTMIGTAIFRFWPLSRIGFLK